MKILIPPAFRYLALLLCIAAIAIPATGIMESYPALSVNEKRVVEWLFCTGLLLFALAGKEENKERWSDARKKALRDTLGFLILVVPVMAFVGRHENGSLNWYSPVEVAFLGLGFFTLMTTFYFYNKKIVVAN